MFRRLLMSGLLVAATAAVALAAPGDRYLHVRVVEQGPDGESVRVNVPLLLAEKILPLVDDHDLKGGRIRINDGDMDAARLRAIWAAVREAPDGEFVTVESRRESVRVARAKDHLLIKVDERDDGGEDVEISLPVTVVDALLSGEGDELNLVAALRALGDHGEGELVSVKSDDSHVRIWVDAIQSGDNGGGR
jgi:hypothetical protein